VTIDHCLAISSVTINIVVKKDLNIYWLTFEPFQFYVWGVSSLGCHIVKQCSTWYHTKVCCLFSCLFCGLPLFVMFMRWPVVFLHVLALYPLPKRTNTGNSWKLFFISISCISIIFCVQIVKYLYKLIVYWKFHIIRTRNKDIDDWNIYLHFFGSHVWGIPLTSAHAQK